MASSPKGILKGCLDIAISQHQCVDSITLQGSNKSLRFNARTLVTPIPSHEETQLPSRKGTTNGCRRNVQGRREFKLSPPTRRLKQRSSFANIFWSIAWPEADGEDAGNKGGRGDEDNDKDKDEHEPANHSPAGPHQLDQGASSSSQNGSNSDERPGVVQEGAAAATPQAEDSAAPESEASLKRSDDQQIVRERHEDEVDRRLAEAARNALERKIECCEIRGWDHMVQYSWGYPRLTTDLTTKPIEPIEPSPSSSGGDDDRNFAEAGGGLDGEKAVAAEAPVGDTDDGYDGGDERGAVENPEGLGPNEGIESVGGIDRVVFFSIRRLFGCTTLVH